MMDGLCCQYPIIIIMFITLIKKIVKSYDKMDVSRVMFLEEFWLDLCLARNILLNFKTTLWII